ncbi:MAG: PorV/PorQ family protein [Elusimicrobia bacterium]|nr:PorV/PorQ family protein [Elusimicrobiota bacterium]
MRAQGLAGAYVGVSDEVGALLWNPAGIQQLTRSEIQLMQANLVEGQKHQHVGMALPVWRRGERETWGLSASVLTMDEFEVLDEGENLGQARPQETAVGLSYARSLWGVSGGLTGKLVQVKTFDQSGQACAIDLGVRSEGNRLWSWGAALSNLGTSLSLGQEKVGLPLVLRAGGARMWRGFRGGSLLTSFQVDAPADDRLGGRAGVEYAGSFVGQWRWAARAGARTFEAEPVSVGAGVGLQSLEINYAFSPQSDWGDVHRFDLTWRFGKPLVSETRRRVLLKQGSTLVGEGRILEARPIMDELETLSPKNREVQALVHKSQQRFAESLDPDALMVLAQKTYGEGDFPKAADLFRKILLVDPAQDAARLWLGKTERKIEEERTVRLKADVAKFRQQELKNLTRQAASRESAGDWPVALGLWQKVLLVGGPSSQVQGRVQMCREKLCDQADRAWANRDAGKALALFEAAERGGSYPRAAQGAEKVRKEAAKQAESRRAEQAKKAAEFAQKIYTRGMAAYVAGDLRKAKELFLEAQALDPQDKNLRQALEHVEEELRLHPGRH